MPRLYRGWQFTNTRVDTQGTGDNAKSVAFNHSYLIPRHESRTYTALDALHAPPDLNKQCFHNPLHSQQPKLSAPSAQPSLASPPQSKRRKPYPKLPAALPVPVPHAPFSRLLSRPERRPACTFEEPRQYPPPPRHSILRVPVLPLFQGAAQHMHPVAFPISFTPEPSMSPA